jgi:hypothetical protein
VLGSINQKWQSKTKKLLTMGLNHPETIPEPNRSPNHGLEDQKKQTPEGV